MFGSRDEKQLFLNIELLATKSEELTEEDWGVQWDGFPDVFSGEDAEE